MHPELAIKLKRVGCLCNTPDLGEVTSEYLVPHWLGAKVSLGIFNTHLGLHVTFLGIPFKEVHGQPGRAVTVYSKFM